MLIWLVVSHIFYFPSYYGIIMDNPSHLLSYFSEGLKPPPSHSLYSFFLLIRPAQDAGQFAPWPGGSGGSILRSSPEPRSDVCPKPLKVIKPIKPCWKTKKRWGINWDKWQSIYDIYVFLKLKIAIDSQMPTIFLPDVAGVSPGYWAEACSCAKKLGYYGTNCEAISPNHGISVRRNWWQISQNEKHLVILGNHMESPYLF